MSIRPGFRLSLQRFTTTVAGWLGSRGLRIVAAAHLRRRAGAPVGAPALDWRGLVWAAGRRVRSRRFRVLAALCAVVVVVSMSVVASVPQRGRGGGTATAGPKVPPPRVGELPERRTALSSTRRNPDGTLTTTVFGGPVNYRAADGSMQPIDTRLYPTAEAGYAWRSGANAFEARFAPTSGSDYAEVRLGGRTVRVRALGVADRPATVSGSQVSYPGAFAGVDLRYQVTATGIEETLDLAGPDAPTRYVFRLSAADGGAGLTAERRPDGSVAVNAAPLHGPAFVLAAPVVTESAGEREVTAPASQARPQLQVVQDGRDLVATLSLDAAWLHAPGRRFPVHLDPTMSLQPDVEDASFVTLANYLPYVSDRLFIGSDVNNWRAALQFDLGALPTDAQVTAASLGLYFDGHCIAASGVPFCGGTSHPMDVHRLTSAWTTSTTFDRLSMDPTAAGSFTLASTLPQGWMNWPVTGLVSGWLAGTAPNYGLIVKRHTEVANSSGPVPPGRRFTGTPTLQPKLQVTYTSDAVDLLEPTTLHSNGADLAWTRYTGPSGALFDRYEVHRSATANFTPNATTLLATIRDPAVTTWRDTTAAPEKQFTYRIVANTSASNARTVTLPAAGLASKSLQPDPATGRNTYLYYSTQLVNCANYGAGTSAWVGTSTNTRWRDIISFDLRDIPPNAPITSATMSLWRQYGANTAMTIEAHRVTRSWQEGTGLTQCTGGATWYESQAGQNWTTQGGDIDAAVAGSVNITAGTASVFDTYTVTGPVQSWVNGSSPNYGVLLRASNESLLAGNSVVYATDDYTASPTLRPRLTVAYRDGSVSQGPTVSVAAPGPGATVSGSAVRLAAVTADDSRVTQVEFMVDGAPVGSDATAPYEMDWNSASVANGAHAITAEATDNAGNTTTSGPVSITVDNTAPPSGTLAAPATASGVVTLSATATDDVGVANVAFLVDGVRVGAPDTTFPYSISWNTLDPLAGIFNGTHQVAAAVTDTSGQVYVTPASSVDVDNLAGNPWGISYTLNDPAITTDDVFPPAMTENTNPGVPTQDPYAGTTNPDGTSGGSLNRSLGSTPQDDGGTPPPTCPQGAYCPVVNVVNTSGTAWSDSTAQVWYRWYAPNGAIMFEGRSTTAFPSSFGKNATQAFPLTIYPPALPPGATQGTFRLRVDVFDPASGIWFAARGTPPMDNPIIVVKSLATKLGLERFYQYDGESVGAGTANLVNVANGDLVLRWSPFFAAGRGLATTTDLTYNSLEDHSKSPAGNNFSLSMSGLIRFGEPLDIHPNKADQISGQANKWVELTDGDGSTHRFIGTTGTDGVTRWTEPAGVNLYLYNPPGSDPNRKWALTRPDKVTFYFDVDGFPTSVEDRNGNRITYTLEVTPPGEDPGGPNKRITRVTDAGGRSFTIAYWSKAEAKKAHVRGNVKRITDHTGSALDFDYYDDGNLMRLTQRGGTTAAGTFLADRSFVFTYTTSNGAGPAIPNAADRVNPEPKTANQSTRLFSVRDPRGAESTYAYYLATDGPQLRWKLKSRTDRLGQTTGYSYDLTNRVTTVNAPLSRATKFGYDTTGKVTSIVNAKNETTGVQWTSDFKVAQVTEPTLKFSSYTYNANGYLTSRTDQAGERTEVTYLDQAVDANDTARHLSLVATVTKPKGVATTTVAGDFQWRYTYDAAGNLDTITDPTGAVTDYDYNPPGSANPGTLAAVHDANGNPATTYPSYDPSGQPTQIRDPLGSLTMIGYDPDGLIRWIQDPNHAGDSGADERAYKTFFDYDSFHRLGRQSAPKSTAVERGNLLWSGAELDANDNAVASIDPHYGPVSGDPGSTAVTRSSYDAMDRRTLETGPDTSADPAGERTRFDYDAAGRLVKLTEPKGVASATTDDYATVTGYDLLDRVTKRTVYGTSTAQARVTQMCYDLAGDLRSVTMPRAGSATITCPGDGPANAPFTTETDYDLAHRPVVQRDDLGHAQRTAYDANGNVSSREKDITTGRVSRTEIDYDQRDAPVLSRERFDGTTGRNAVTRIEYDGNGNRTRVISPRGSDTGGAGPYTFYVTTYSYDADNRLVRIALPFDGRDGTERQYVHRVYDANGNMLSSSLPVTSSSATGVGTGARTVMTYFDPGWVRTSDDPTNPKVHFDYAAQGWQSERLPETKTGSLDTDRRMTWEYFVDGQLKTRKDQGGQSTTYTYDANNNLLTSLDGAGVTDPSEKAVETQASYTGFDEVAKARHRKQGATVWTFTDYTYDNNGNVTVRRENGEENDAGTQSKAPRRYQLTYDGADWLTQQLDLGTDSTCKDDTRTVNAWQGTGWEKQRDTYRANASCTSDPATWPKKQTTIWTQFDNGKLRHLETRNGSGTVTESHDVGYFDTSNVYVNGNRTTDRYVLERSDGNTATTCRAASPCDAQYGYDARDRLIRHQQRAGKVNTYTFDEPAKLLGDNTIRAGNVTTEVKNGQTTSRRYTGNQVTDATIGAATAKYWYEPTGNLDCVTTSAGSSANCSPSAGGTASNLIADYSYDYLNRLASSRMYSGSTRTDMATYTYDALDRTTKETEDHADPGKDRTTNFTYQGLTGLVTEEKQAGGANPKTKTYAYDNYGHRLQMSDKNNATGVTDTYTYGTDVHGSISQLITDAGKVKASYGYDAYGGSDAPSTDSQSLTTGDTDNQTPLNPYRYSGKRMDSGTAASTTPAGPAGSAQYDMGARRFGPDISKFLQQDMFYTALGDLGLALDPLTQNTYALAGGNPISYMEYDGHMLIADGGGGGSTSTNPTTSTSGASSGSSGSESGGGGDSGNPDWGERLRPNWRTWTVAGLDFTSDWLRQKGEDAIELGRLRAGLHLLRAQTPSANRLLRLPGLRSMRESFWNTRASFSEWKGNVIGKTLGGAGRALGAVGAGITAWEGWNEQQKLDANRGDLSSTERGIRSGVRAGLAAGGAVAGATAGGALCGPACAMVGGWAGSHVGNWVADRAFDVVDNVDWSPEGNNVGEKAWNLTKDVGGALEDTLNPFD